MVLIKFKCLFALCLLNVAVMITSVSYVVGDDFKEGFFNGSSYVRLLTPISLYEHIGLSFKSCLGGKLFEQSTNGNTISLQVQPEGLLFQSKISGKYYDVRMPVRLLNNAWHVVNLIYRLGNLTLYTGGHQLVIANKTYNAEILQSNFSSKNSVLQVGDGFIGCILEGPSLVFVPSNFKSVNVLWGPCSLHPVNCPKMDPCSTDVCMGRGICVSKNDQFECHCTPRYSGVNCEIDKGSPCEKGLCENGARCIEDRTGNYTCVCDPAHTGTHCELKSEALPCETDPCKANATCRVTQTLGHPECICLPGFKGQFCEINIDECQSNPCKNGGTCTDGVNDYTCYCGQLGYTGVHCEVNVNECEPVNPCLNQGTCFDNYGGYTCQCPSGFGGHNCELNLNECGSGPCRNGGQCIDKIGSYECICRPGFTGNICESNVDECAEDPAPCVPDYDCIDGIASYTCVCKPGFEGEPPNCTELSNYSTCSVNVCKNGGTCFMSKDRYICVCPVGFTGQTCEQNECFPNPCLNGGTCIKDLNGYLCVCSEQFFGVNCERSENPCSKQPCLNKGICYPKSKQEYFCECQPGFEGMNCEIMKTDCGGGPCVEEHTLCPEALRKSNSCSIAPGKSVQISDPCYSNPCNNGTCQSNGKSYTCICQEGITGANCETDIDECKENRTICNYGVCYNALGGYQCFCRPGYAGNQCDIDIDECLSRPCKHDAKCENEINGFRCVCTPGYTGVDCGIDINECESNPCQNGGSCNDEVAGFICVCPPGLTGVVCETNIDDCQSQPCENGGQCLDGINSYQCNCTDTGYYGLHCEHNIDDCISNPCLNGAQCTDRVKSYHCECHPGYKGINCEIDINECEDTPCHNGGTCLEHSNQTLYQLSNNITLPDFFLSDFDYEKANGFECVCVPGTVGMQCEKDINECESNPCHFGSCKDEIGGYKCECEDGYEGEFCESEINECERYRPCINGTCSDRKNDYYCDCVNGFGGKNCSVELIGCAKNNCENNGICLPYLENEMEHKFNCTCQNGFHGKLCQKGTTMSLSGSSHVLINTTREEGYDIQFRFKTTLPNGLLAIGKGLTFYILELVNGRLNLRSSLLNKWEGVFVGSGLNDSKWQKVFVAINASHLVLAANEEQTIYPNNLNDANTSHTSFPTTYLGNITYLRGLTNGRSSFIGCIEDVQVNGKWVIPEDNHEESKTAIVLSGIEAGCPRTEQCNPNPCHNGGHCTDLWSDFNCSCERPFLGHTCQYNLTAGTFGHENITSYVMVAVNESTERAVRNIVDISMFIRTRQDRGLIFYLGSKPGTLSYKEETFILAQLEGGELRVRIQFTGNQESYSVGGVKLDNGYSHLIQIIRNSTSVQFRINNTEYFRNTIGASEHLKVQVLYLGGLPNSSPLFGLEDQQTKSINKSGISNTSRAKRQFEPPPSNRISIMPDARIRADPNQPEISFVNFKGIIQDVQISNGSRTNWVVEFFPLKVKDLEIPPSFGEVTFDPDKVLEGEISDDTCRNNPCLHNGSCYITWNDYSCTCPRGYKGKSCQEMEFCQLQDCPTGSKCRNLDDGYECVANVTLRGHKKSALSYRLEGISKSEQFEDVFLDLIHVSFRTRIGGTLLHISMQNKYYFSISTFKDDITVIWKLDDTPGDKVRFSGEKNGNWTSIYLTMKNGKISGGFVDNIDPEFTVINFPVEKWRSMLQTGRVLLGGVEDDFRLEDRASSSTNTVDSAVSNEILSVPYKGCLGEVRIGNMLLPFFTPKYLYNENFTAKNYFALETLPSELVSERGCILCFDDECKNGGSCLNENITYACDCPIGYAEEDCSHDIDWCAGETHCQNSGTCVDGIANFTCNCQFGFTGPLCETNIDECASNPCINGECVDEIGTFRCICNDSYTGERCENLKIITCDDRPCKSGSSCTNAFNPATGDNYTCNCATGYVGRHCDTPFCVEKECLNGECEFMKNTPRCICRPGYEGRYCEDDINECLSGPCQNGGTCSDRIDGYDCLCAPGFEGNDCELDVNECKTGEAICGDGICNNTFGSYKCICDPKGEEKMCGRNCNITDPCSMINPCENGGTCIERCTDIPLYDCECSKGFRGENCTEPDVGEGTSPADIAIIVGPIVAFLLLAGGVGLSIFIMMARKKRATRGTYSPSQQEYCNPRVEMDNVLKPPPEERLI